jgi:hypothetical protein
VGYSGSRSISGHDSAYGSSRHGVSYGGMVLKLYYLLGHLWSCTYFNFHVNLHQLMQVLLAVVMLVECTHQVTVVAMRLVDLM